MKRQISTALVFAFTIANCAPAQPKEDSGVAGTSGVHYEIAPATREAYLRVANSIPNTELRSYLSEFINDERLIARLSDQLQSSKDWRSFLNKSVGIPVDTQSTALQKHQRNLESAYRKLRSLSLRQGKSASGSYAAAKAGDSASSPETMLAMELDKRMSIPRITESSGLALTSPVHPELAMESDRVLVAALAPVGPTVIFLVGLAILFLATVGVCQSLAGESCPVQKPNFIKVMGRVGTGFVSALGLGVGTALWISGLAAAENPMP